jgi:hypothetical protein
MISSCKEFRQFKSFSAIDRCMAVEPSGVHERFHSWTLMMGGEMNVVTRRIFLAMVGMILVVTASDAADVDRSAVDFKTPGDIKWVRNAAGTNESAVLFGDPSKPGPYVVRLRWLPGNMSRPHFHPNDRFFVVLSGTWWMGTGEKFDPDSTVPVPAGSYVVHYGGKVHYDGAKNEEAVIQVWGMGPATSTPAEKR